MDFKDMKVIWDTQNNQALYAVDEAALHASIRRRSRKFKRLVNFSEVAMMVAWVGLAVIYLVDPLARGEEYHQLVSAGILAALALRLTVEIVRRRSTEAGFDRSIRGDLDRAVWQIDNHIRWARSLGRWYLLPMVMAISIDFVFDLSSRMIWLWAAAVVLMALAAWGVEWEIRALYLPKKDRLEELRSKLIEAER